VTKQKQAALIKRLEKIHVPVVDVDADSVTIMGADFGKVIALAKGSSFFTSPVGTDRIRLR
jgi:hypothetical protein